MLFSFFFHQVIYLNKATKRQGSGTLQFVALYVYKSSQLAAAAVETLRLCLTLGPEDHTRPLHPAQLLLRVCGI